MSITLFTLYTVTICVTIVIVVPDLGIGPLTVETDDSSLRNCVDGDWFKKMDASLIMEIFQVVLLQTEEQR